MTKGAFYNAFGSKENFLLRAIKNYGDQNVQRIKLQLSEKTIDPLKRLTDFYQNMLLAQPKNNFVGCMINTIMSEMSINNPEIAEATRIEFSIFVDAIADCIKEAQQKKEIIDKLNALEITELLHCTFYGILTILKADKDVEKANKMMQQAIHNVSN